MSSGYMKKLVKPAPIMSAMHSDCAVRLNEGGFILAVAHPRSVQMVWNGQHNQ